MCGVCIWPEGSPACNIIDVDYFDNLENDINNDSIEGPVFITGDFNARVGRKHDFIVFDQCVDFLDCENYIPDNFLSRASMGKNM